MIILASSRILELGARCGRVADYPGIDTIFLNISAFVGTNPNGGLITTE
jgi:hypothetical protein